MSREELLISLLKSKQNIAELLRSKDNNAEIEKTKKNVIKKQVCERKKKKIKFCFGEYISEYLKEIQRKNSLTEQEKRDGKHYTKKLKKAEELFKKLKENLSRLKKY